MKYNIIADGDYIRERRRILKDLHIWYMMTDDEKSFFRVCHRCKAYNEYALNKDANTCPCGACQHCKTEIQVDNRMVALRHKYF